jgi:hypothetical protein
MLKELGKKRETQFLGLRNSVKLIEAWTTLVSEPASAPRPREPFNTLLGSMFRAEKRTRSQKTWMNRMSPDQTSSKGSKKRVIRPNIAPSVYLRTAPLLACSDIDTDESSARKKHASVCLAVMTSRLPWRHPCRIKAQREMIVSSSRLTAKSWR